MQLLQNKKQFFFCCFVFFVILPLKFLVLSPGIYQSGEFSPFVSHYLYAADVFFLLGLFFCGLSFPSIKNCKFDKNLLFMSSFFVLFGLCSLLFSINLSNSIFSFLRILEFFILYLLLVFEIISFRPLIFTFLGALVVSSVIGISQFVLQHSLGLKLLGESVISNSMVGVAKLDLFNSSILRAYGTFAHPNIFSGFLIISFIFIYIFYKKEILLKNRINILVLFLLLSAFLLTFSKTTLIAFILLPFFLFHKKISRKLKIFLFGLIALLFILALVSEVASLERLRFMEISWKLFLNKPLGVGIGNFTDAMSQFSYYKLFPWNYQPVHNVFLLVLNEIGFPGAIVFLLIFVYGIYETLKSKEYVLFALLFVLIIISLFDHYLFSLYQGQFLFWFVMAYVTCSRSERLRHP